MKNILTAILFALTSTIALGQSNYQDVVYLKNGSIIRGVIIEQVPNKSIKIETADRNVFFYPIDEIEKLTKEPYPGKERSAHSNTGSQSGYKGIVETGYQVGIGGYASGRLKLNIINGYQFNPHFSIGLGTGLRYYTDEGSTLVPLFADFRVNFMDNKVSPYFSLGTGYSFDASDGFAGVGVLLNPAIGVNFKPSDKIGIHVGIDYEMQRMTFSHYSYSYTPTSYSSNSYTTSENSGAIGLTVGMSF